MPDLRFELPPPVDPPAEKLTFTIAGLRRTDDQAPGTDPKWEPFEERFTVVDYLPFAVLQDLAATAEVVDGELTYSKPATMRFMHRAVVPADQNRWFALVRDSGVQIKLEVVATIMLAIVGERGGVPTGPQSSSAAGSAVKAATNGSEAGSSSPATTPPASPPGP